MDKWVDYDSQHNSYKWAIWPLYHNNFYIIIVNRTSVNGQHAFYKWISGCILICKWVRHNSRYNF